MVVEALLAGAWVTGVVEGGSIFAHATTNEKTLVLKSELIVPAILYGTLSLPFSLIGASPGSSIITKLHSISKNENFKEVYKFPSSQGIRTEDSRIANENIVPNSGMVKRRVDLIREENRKTLAGARNLIDPIPSPKTQEVQSNIISRYLATLDGRPLPTPLAEAMRRIRFILVGASLATVILMQQKQHDEARKQTEIARKLMQEQGKDEEAVQSFIAGSTSGAVVRLCNSWKYVPIKTDGIPQKFATIPILYTTSPKLSKITTSYWNHGNKPFEWGEVPISRNWLMRRKDDDICVLEVDATPTSLKDYFHNTLAIQETLNLLQAALMSETLISFAVKKHIISSNSHAVQVVLGTRARSQVEGKENVIYIEATRGVKFQIRKILENMARDAEAGLLRAKDMIKTSSETNDGAEFMDTSSLKDVSIGVLKPILPVRYVQFALIQAITLVDSVGSVVRQVTSSTIDYLQKNYKHFHQYRVVHVISDEKKIIEFLQQCFQGWRIIWYDSNKADNINQYIKTITPITIICCSTDEITEAFAKVITMGKPQVLLIFQQLQLKSENDRINGVSTLNVQEVHNNIFSQVRELLLEGKTKEEVQKELELIQSDG
mmetsp:Transcript_13496/g.14985  ORF Transcript_13496/g.14985 Transcript_13496/m.14985 type:complete len:606 (-) Transcript_13496:10-1827(-)